jgi:predicted urease superfamily metal-dependent hydrolase
MHIVPKQQNQADQLLATFHIRGGIRLVSAANFWDITPCSLYVNTCFRGMYHLHIQGWKSAELETGVYHVATLQILYNLYPS